MLHSLTMQLIISSLSTNNQYLQFCCALSILLIIYFVFMALFSASMRRHSVPLLRFTFRSHVQIFSYEISLICRLKYPYSCFSSHFSFLVLFCCCCCCCCFDCLILSALLLVVVIIFSLLFLIYSSCPRIDSSTQSSMQASPLPPSFLDTYSLSIPPLGYKTLCIVISSLVIRSIC